MLSYKEGFIIKKILEIGMVFYYLKRRGVSLGVLKLVVLGLLNIIQMIPGPVNHYPRLVIVLDPIVMMLMLAYLFWSVRWCIFGSSETELRTHVLTSNLELLF